MKMEIGLLLTDIAETVEDMKLKNIDRGYDKESLCACQYIIKDILATQYNAKKEQISEFDNLIYSLTK